MNRKQFLFFLYSTPNIVGSVLGILGLLLFFSGLIQDFWFLIVLGLYLIGLIATPRNPHYELSLRQQLSVDELRDALENLNNAVQKHLPDDIYAKVASIKVSILSILPQIADINSADHNIYVIRQTVLDYLPEALQNYLNLPPAFANVHPLKNGKTARQLLDEQLDLLDNQMKEIVIDIHRDDAQKLVVHGRFLEDKFRDADLLFGLNQRQPVAVNSA